MILGHLKILVALYTCPHGRALTAEIARIVDAAKPTVNTRCQALMAKGMVWASPDFPRKYYLTRRGKVFVASMAGRSAA